MKFNKFKNFKQSIFDMINEEAENQENYEELETLVRKGAMIKVGTKGGGVAYVPKTSSASQNCGYQRFTKPLGIAALIDLAITRVTANIAGTDIEYALFCQNAFATQYSGIVNPVVGGTFVTDSTNPLQFDFVHTVGANTDRVRLTSTQIPYASFLQAQSSDVFRIEHSLMSLSDQTQVSAFNRAIFLGSRSLFGASGRNPLPPQSFRRPSNLQTGLVEIGSPEKPLGIGIDKSAFWISSIQATAGFSVTQSMFISRVDKLDKSIL